MNIITFAKSGVRFLRGWPLLNRNQINCVKEFHGLKCVGWSICPQGITKNSIVYSFGIGTEISFELSLMEKYSVNVYGFDPTPKSIDWVKKQDLPNRFRMFDFGIANYDGTAIFNPPVNPEEVSHTMLERPSTSQHAITVEVRRLQAIMKSLGHDHIDILKMDIEGAEYGVIKDIIAENIEISQILIEFHTSFPNVGVPKTKDAVKQLNENGYKIFNIECRHHYSFIRMIK